MILKKRLSIITTISLICIILVCAFGLFYQTNSVYAESLQTDVVLFEEFTAEAFEQGADAILQSAEVNQGQYESSYAGMYIKDDILYVCATNDVTLEKYKKEINKYYASDEFKKLTNIFNEKSFIRKDYIDLKQDISQKVHFEIRKYSYNTLNEIKSKISEFDDKKTICSISIIQRYNAVVVEMNKFASKIESALIQDKCKTIVNDSDVDNTIIKYTYGVPIKAHANQAWAGRKVKYGFLWLTYGTIGFNAYDTSTGQYGIVTNSHVAKPNTNMYNHQTKLMGKRSKGNHNDGGNIDAAFVPFKNQNDWTPVRTINEEGNDYRDRVAYTSNSYLEGSSIKKYGATTGLTNGVILSSNCEINCEYSEGIRKIKDCVKYSNPSQSGDSGGPFGKGLPRSGGFELKGINFAGPKDSSATYGIGVKIDNVTEALGVVVLSGSGYPY